MNTRTTMIVLVIAILLGVFFLIFETDLFDQQASSAPKREAQSEEQAPRSGELLFAEGSLPPAWIERITLQAPDQPAVVLQREANGWWQTHPVRFPLQDWTIRDIVESISSLRQTSRINPENSSLSLERMGLAPARMTVQLDGEGIEQTIRLGREAAGGRGYLQRDDQQVVYVVNDALHKSLLTQSPAAWRKLTLSNLTAGQADRIVLTREGQAIELVKREGQWELVQPVTGRADRTAAESLVNALNSATITGFVQDNPDSLAAYGLANPAVSLTVAQSASSPDHQSRPHTLALGSPQSLTGNEYFAMWNETPVVFTLGKNTWDTLQKTVDDLRDPRITPVSPSDVSEVTINPTGSQSLHLVKNAGVWSFGDPEPDFPLEPKQARDLVNQVASAKASAYRTDVPEDQPDAVLTLGVIGQSGPERLRFWKQKDGNILVVRADEQVAYVLPAEQLSLVFAPPLTYRDRTVLDLAPEDLVALHLQRTGENAASYQIHRASEAASAWDLTGLDDSAVRNLISQLTPLRASGWVMEPKMYVPEGVTVRLTLRDGTEHVLTIHPEAREAELTGIDSPFRISPALVEAATAELRDRSVLSLDIDQIASVTVDGVTIHRRDGRYSIQNQRELNEQAAGGLFDTLAGLRAERYLGDGQLPDVEPSRRIGIVRKNGQSSQLKLWLLKGREDGRAVGQMDQESPFILAPQTTAILMADLQR